MKKKIRKIIISIFGNRIKKFERTNYRECILVYDIPLIYETKSEKNMIKFCWLIVT